MNANVQPNTTACGSAGPTHAGLSAVLRTFLMMKGGTSQSAWKISDNHSCRWHLKHSYPTLRHYIFEVAELLYAVNMSAIVVLIRAMP